jgi:hypothetical protein
MRSRLGVYVKVYLVQSVDVHSDAAVVERTEQLLPL